MFQFRPNLVITLFCLVGIVWMATDVLEMDHADNIFTAAITGIVSVLHKLVEKSTGGGSE